jgi:hypothetical protein
MSVSAAVGVSAAFGFAPAGSAGKQGYTLDQAFNY